MKKGPSDEIRYRIECIEGMDILDAAKKRYITEQRSLRWLALHWNVNGRTVSRVLKSCDIEPRHGGEAVRTQWIDAAQRRLDAGKKLAGINHCLALEGRHVRQGKNKGNSELIRAVAAKLRSSTSFRRKEVIEKSSKTREATRRQHPERMSALRRPLSEAEKIMAAYLTAKSLPFEQRGLVGSYIVDFVIPTLGLVVDCQGRNRFPLSYKRHKAIMAEGYRVAYCVNDFVKRGVFTNLDNYISRFQLLRSDPSAQCAETVIFGACGNAPFGDDTDKFVVNRLGVRANYFTELTAAADH